MNLHKKKCSFCNRGEDKVHKIFYSNKLNIFICDKCVGLLHNYKHNKSSYSKIRSPEQIYDAVKEFVVGQEEALKTISIIFFKHLLAVNSQNNSSKEEYKKIRSNMLILGPSGSGKTYIVEIIAKILDIPVLIVDSTAITAAGYVGDDVENVLARLIKTADGNITRAEKGIIFLDEVDKIVKKDYSGRFKDIGGESVQQNFLRIIEGTRLEVNLDNRKLYSFKSAVINTHNIMFIGAGCFEGIYTKMKNNKNNSDSNSMLRLIDNRYKPPAVLIRDSLISEGLIREFAGRFSTVAMLTELSFNNIYSLFFNQDSRMQNYINILSSYGCKVDVDEDVYHLLTKYAIDLKIGARGVNCISDQLFNQMLYNINSRNSLDYIKIDVEQAEKIINYGTYF